VQFSNSSQPDKNVCQCVSDQLVLRASSGVSSLCSLLAVIGQTQSDLLAIAPAKLVFAVFIVHIFCFFKTVLRKHK